MQKIVIYSDEGVDGGSLKQLIRSLQQEVDLSQFAIVRMGAKDLIEQSWEGETALLIFPGGRDVFYHAALDGAGTDKIRLYVQNGGNYFGICAGAYFASSSIEFEKGGRLEVCGYRSLRFFPGIARGPAYGPNKYSYESAQGVEAARISSQVGDCPVYFNGGCLFDADEHYPWVKTLSRYLDLPGHPSAGIEIELGKGLVLLSGVHIEYSPRLLNREDPHLTGIVPVLEGVESKRREIFRSYLKRLGVPPFARIKN
jgi:glutamine amidotransferase-like uncharacterized protein